MKPKELLAELGFTREDVRRLCRKYSMRTPVEREQEYEGDTMDRYGCEAAVRGAASMKYGMRVNSNWEPESTYGNG